MAAPALTRHFLYRIPGHLNPRYCAHNAERAALWTALLFRINSGVAAYQTAFGGPTTERFWIKALAPAGPSPHQYYASDTAFFTLGSIGGLGFRARLRVDIFLETFAFTLMIDRIDPDGNLGLMLAGLPQAPTAENIRKVYAAFSPEDATFPSPAADVLGRPMPEEVGELEAICGALSEDQLATLGTARRKFGGAERQFSRAFAEFRALILPANPALTFVDSQRAEFLEDGADRRELTPAIKGFLTRNDRLIREFVCRDWQSPPSQEPASGIDADLMSAEAVVCGMLGGRALYASPLSMAPTERDRVNFLAVYDGVSQAQLGRFIRRLHVMGELRLSALMDLDSPQVAMADPGPARPRHLVEAGQDIRRIGADLKRVETGSLSPSAADVEQILRDYQKLNNCSPDGLVFRVERSRYYSDSFKMRVQDLRIVRLEGWQPYDEFVRRYLFQIYELISSIGVRYEALGRRIDRMQSFRIGQSIAQQTEAASRLQEQSVVTGKAIARQTEAASKLQRRGEDIAILAGLYYGYHVLQEVPAANEGLFQAGEDLVVAAAVIVILDVLLLGRLIRHWLIFGLKSARRPVARALRRWFPKAWFLRHPREEAEEAPEEALI